MVEETRPISPWSDSSGVSASAVGSGLVTDPSVSSQQHQEQQEQRRQQILSRKSGAKKRWKKPGSALRRSGSGGGTRSSSGNADPMILPIGEPPLASPAASSINTRSQINGTNTSSSIGVSGRPRTGGSGGRENRDDCVPSATSSEASAPTLAAAPGAANAQTWNDGSHANSNTKRNTKRRGFRSMVRVRQTTRKSITLTTSASASASTSSASPTAPSGDRGLLVPSLADVNDDSGDIIVQKETISGSSSNNRPTAQIVAQEVSTTERTVGASSSDSNTRRRPLVSILHHSFVESCLPSRLDGMNVDDDGDYAVDDIDGNVNDVGDGNYRNHSSYNSNGDGSNKSSYNNYNDDLDDNDDAYQQRNYCVVNPFSSSSRTTATKLTHDDEARIHHRLDDIEDPTVQESVECVFAHQLEDGLVGFFDDDDDEDDGYDDGDGDGGGDAALYIGSGKNKSTRRKSALAKLSAKLPSPTGGGPNAFRFFEPRSRSASSRSSATTVTTANDAASRRRSAQSKRNETAVAAVLGIPYELQQTASDAEVLAASRRSISDSSGIGSLPARPSTTTSAAASGGGRSSSSNSWKRATPPLPPPFARGDRSATTGSIRHVKGSTMDVGKKFNEKKEDHLAAHELNRRTWSRKFFDSRSLVFIGTIDGDGAAVGENAGVDSTNSSRADVTCPSCHSGRRHTPHAPPELWPQAPLLLRPTPGSSTRIRGIRFSGSDEYIWKPGSGRPSDDGGEEPASSASCWSDALYSSRHGTAATSCDSSTKTHTCHECASIPVNNGNERPGEALVVDFESDLFIGTLLIRIRNSKGTTQAPYDDSFGYFTGMNRRYQAVVRGMFKKDGIAMTDCVTGQILNRKCGKLPPKMLLRGAIKVISFFAPQLQTKLDGDRPICISPLGSTPQVMRLKRENGYDDSYQADQTIELSQEEPHDLASSLLALIPHYGFELCKADTSVARAKVRKKAFDKLYAENDKSLVFDTSTEYSFEFLQHLIDFESFGVDLGSMIGTVLLKEMLDGQPLKLMAAKRSDVGDSKRSKGLGDIDLDYIWSFDIFHECVYSDARKNN